MQRLSPEPATLHVAQLAPMLEALQRHLGLTILLHTAHGACLELRHERHASQLLWLEATPGALPGTLRLEADNAEFERLAPTLMAQGARCLEASRDRPSASRGCAWRVLIMPLPGGWQLMLLALDPRRCQPLGLQGMAV